MDFDARLIYTQLLKMVCLLAGIVIFGTMGFAWIEDWSFFDSLYMTVITLSTVGYGETHHLSDGGRIFTMVLIAFGITTIAYGLSTFTAFVVEGEFSDLLRRRRMKHLLEKMSNHYIVCGGGNGGDPIIEELRKTGKSFLVIEKDSKRVHELREEGYVVLEGDATHDEVLERAGIMRAKGLFSALSDDPDNVFVTVSARALNSKLRIVAREEGLGRHSKLKLSGANAVVNPAAIGGLRMTSEMVRPNVVGFLDWMIRDKDSNFRFEEITISEDCPYIGKSVQFLHKPEGNAALILAIKPPDGNEFAINPDSDRKINPGDTLVVLGNLEHLKELREEVRCKS